jgi:hypothetical protein
MVTQPLPLWRGRDVAAIMMSSETYFQEAESRKKIIMDESGK